MGLNAEQRLREGGIQANRVSPSQSMMVPVSALWQAPEGHPLHDPRSAYPVDQAMAEDMADRHQRGDRVLDHAVLVREEPTEGRKRRLHVCNGSQRTNALRRAVEILRERGVFKKNEDLYIPADFFTGDDAEFLEARIRANHDKWRKGDAPSVLSVRARQLTAFGRTPAQIAAHCPDGYGPKEIDALLRWGNLTKEARTRFDAGAPIGLLAAVLDAPREEQIATLDRLLAAGIKSAKGATRRMNREAGRAPRWTPKRLVKAADLVAPKDARVSSDRELVAMILRFVAGESVTLPEKIAQLLMPGKTDEAEGSDHE